MARTGRFGRLPTQAPDLSSQIVSMMEQWQNARDRNILDAWTNKGKFEGKKVTDRDITNYYRKRRNSYDKDDPEWDQWNNELSQMRFRISNETVMMNYRMGKVGPAAVAAHYRKWAATMPKNSSYYRNMMQSAGQFAKAASAGRSAAAKQFDYNALARRVNALNGPINALGKFTEVLNNYARSIGQINSTESVFTLNTFEAADFAGMMAGLDRSGDPEWAEFKKAQLKEDPSWNGQLSWSQLDRMTNRAITAKRNQIAEYKKAPSDYSSVIAGLRTDIGSLKDIKRIKPWVNAMEDYEVAHLEWLTGREEGDDPATFLQGDKGYIADLQKVRQNLLDAAMFAEAGDVYMEIQAVKGNTEAVNGTNNEALWQNSRSQTASSAVGRSDLEVLAEGQNTMIEGQRLLLEGKAYKVRIAPDISETAMSLGAGVQQTWSIQPFDIDPKTGKPNVPSEGYMPVARRDPTTGGLYTEMLIGYAIYDDEKNVIGYKAASDGFSVFKLRDPQDPLSWFYTTEDLFKPENGVRLSQQQDGSYVLEQDPNFTTTYTDRRQEVMDRNPAAVLDRLEGEIGPRPGAGATPAAVKAWEDAVADRQAKIDALEDVKELGISKEDLPTLGPNNTVQEGGPDEISRMVDELRTIFPIGSANTNIEDEAAQTAFVRDYLRQTWDDGIDGPLPESLAYNQEDAQYVHPDGRPTNRETFAQRQERIALDGEDIYDGGQPPTFQPGEVPAAAGATDLSQTPLGQMLEGEQTGEPLVGDVTLPGQAEAAPDTTIPSLADEWGANDDWSSRLVYEWGIIGGDETRSFSSSVLAHADADPNDDIGEKDTAQVMEIVALDPTATAYTVEKSAYEWDAHVQLTGLRGLNRTLSGLDARGDLDPLVAGAAYGELEAANQSRIPALDRYYDAQVEQPFNPLTGQTYSTPEFEAQKSMFIHQAPGEKPKTGGLGLRGTQFDEASTAGGTQPAAPPASTVWPNVPQPASLSAAAPKPVSWKMPNMPDINPLPAPTVKAPRMTVAPAPAGFPPMPTGWSAPVPKAPPPPPTIESAWDTLMNK